MALWRDPLDELIEDLERTLPTQPTLYNPRLPWRNLVEMQRMLQEVMKSARRVPLRLEPTDDQEPADHRDGSKPTP